MDIQRRIDDVARRMTAAEPSGRIRERVLERLIDRRATTAWRIHMIAVAVTIALAAGGTALRLWTSADDPARLEPMAVAAARPPKVAAGTVPLTIVGTAPVSSRVMRGAAAADAQGEEPASEVRALPALVPSSAIVLTDIQPIRLEIPLLGLTPLANESLTVAPLAAALGG